MAHLHTYKATTKWVGNLGRGTSDYRAYERNHEIAVDQKPTLYCSSDPDFRGDATRHNPEELFLASLSGCHMLWFLHLCSVNGVIVTTYIDEASATMEENSDGSGQFAEVTLSPLVTVTEKDMLDKVNGLHHKANTMCFIARSVRFPVRHNPTTVVEEQKNIR